MVEDGGAGNKVYREYPVTRILEELNRNNLLPAILFRTARRQCDMDLQRLTQMDRGHLNPDHQRQLMKEIETIVEKYSIDRSVLLSHPQYAALIQFGVGAHHAGQLLVWRLLLEELMSRGFLRIMIATGTVAAGVDFPARTVVVTAHSKRGAEGFRVLTASEFQQMSGRAGRRGKDTVGICLVAPSAFSDARLVAEVAHRPPEPLKSAYFASPSTVLNLLRYRNVDDLRYTVSRSLAAFLDRKAARSIKADAEAKAQKLKTASDIHESLRRKSEKQIRRSIRESEILETKQIDLLNRSLDGLERLGHLENGSLSTKGYWAANLWTTLVLELAEAIDKKLFLGLDAKSLVGLVASISGDPHKPYLTIRDNPLPEGLIEKMEGIVARVGELYDRPPSSSDITVRAEAATTVITWMEAKDWLDFSPLLRLAGVAEGDVARLVTQTADHLNQITRLHESHPDLARIAEEGRLSILRPPLVEVLVGEGEGEYESDLGA